MIRESVDEEVVRKAIKNLLKDDSIYFIDIGSDSTEGDKDWGCDIAYVSQKLTEHINHVLAER